MFDFCLFCCLLLIYGVCRCFFGFLFKVYLGLYYVAFGWYMSALSILILVACLVVWLVWFWWWFACLDLVTGWFGLAFVVSVWCLCCAFALLVFRCLCSLAFVFNSLRFWWFGDLFDYLLFDGSLFVGVCCLGVGFLGWFWLFCLVVLVCFCFLLFWSDFFVLNSC